MFSKRKTLTVESSTAYQMKKLALMKKRDEMSLFFSRKMTDIVNDFTDLINLLKTLSFNNQCLLLQRIISENAEQKFPLASLIMTRDELITVINTIKSCYVSEGNEAHIAASIDETGSTPTEVEIDENYINQHYFEYKFWIIKLIKASGSIVKFATSTTDIFAILDAAQKVDRFNLICCDKDEEHSLVPGIIQLFEGDLYKYLPDVATCKKMCHYVADSDPGVILKPVIIYKPGFISNIETFTALIPYFVTSCVNYNDKETLDLLKNLISSIFKTSDDFNLFFKLDSGRHANFISDLYTPDYHALECYLRENIKSLDDMKHFFNFTNNKYHNDYYALIDHIRKRFYPNFNIMKIFIKLLNEFHRSDLDSQMEAVLMRHNNAGKIRNFIRHHFPLNTLRCEYITKCVQFTELVNDVLQNDGKNVGELSSTLNLIEAKMNDKNIEYLAHLKDRLKEYYEDPLIEKSMHILS